MRLHDQTLTERLIFQATAAARCREAADTHPDPRTRESLLRAADRYSESVAELADEIARGAVQ